MAKKIDSQKIMLDHSEAKVRLLGKYLDRYLNIIANDGYTKKIRVFDLFCGEGLYSNNGKGSPIVILENVRKVHYLNSGKNTRIPPIDVCFNDINSTKTEKVKAIVAEKKLHDPAFGNLEFRNKDYKEIIPKLTSFVSKMKNEKAFIFIDPYGYKEIRASEIKSLVETKKCEVLLFLPTQFMYRFDEKGTPEALIELLDDLVKYDNWTKNDSVYKFIDQFKEGFKAHLGSGFFVDTFSIQKDKNTVFCLFFFSSHIKGFEKMLEAKWEIDEDEGKGWSYERTGNLFASQKTNPLEEKLLIFLVESTRDNKEIYKFTLESGFLPKHVNEILNQLQTANRIEVTTNKGEKARKGSFYISYPYSREEGFKVRVKLV